ncbi:MAG TPA: iron chelate uptake ABC transporter family permease subunit [Limnochordales bacterium]|uniref:Iron chelate uptake ABC transporter family permease subunit n=1 Tax=Geochorda subterranea TaxID=3109564 RepID=A0ABZ1BNK3_9FIRM|nr:iron chelate uptake ABC transporter family permease subunit [Limnochorda sp. LNt]WRP14299.1 iron chelate uptake ABC transporter family permease subunit [Limnochorda sp. LNt]
MRVRGRLVAVAVVAAALVAVYVLVGLTGSYALSRRVVKMAAVALVASSVAPATIIFQTMTHNRILAPSIIGMDSLYLLTQTATVFFLGATHLAWADARVNFVIASALMLLFALGLYRLFVVRGEHHLYFILLVGIVLGTLFQSLVSFLQMLIDPNEFLVVQGRMFAGFNNVPVELLGVAAGAVLLMAIWMLPTLRYLDVLALGRDHAVNLGVDYPALTRRLWVAVSVLVAVSTALVGPITFLGLLMANLAQELLATYRRTVLMAGATLLSVAALAGAVLVVERVLGFSTTVSVIVNLAGSAYFLHLILKEHPA